MGREGRRIAQETLRILDAGGYLNSTGLPVALSEALSRSVRGTRCYMPDELDGMLALARSGTENAEKVAVEVSEENTLAGASRLKKSWPDARLGVLNFASARNPGGGFESGAQAQEESLARSSGLIASLKKCPGFYEYHRQQDSALYSDRVIYSPDCPVFRSDDGRLLDEIYVVDFLTCAAPNASAIRRNRPADESRIEPVFRKRIGKVLAVAYRHGCQNLVLGAWGCGVFGNDPVMVANLFQEYFGLGGVFERRFERVLFAICDMSDDHSIYQPFAQAFSAR